MTNEMNVAVWCNARIAPEADPGNVIGRGAIAVRGERIAWIGVESELPAEYSNARQHDLAGRWVTPGLIDCHTHLVYAGSRADEFALRLAGATYEEIARGGGGIVSTVKATRAADEESLYRQSARRLEALLAEGVTAVEIKSGYGLDLPTERKMLRVARRLGADYPVTVYTTFLGAHAVPPEYHGRADEYIAHTCNDVLPRLHEEGLVDAVDVFCENIGFSTAQCERVFDAAARLGLPVKMHAEQLSNFGATRLASSYGAMSADHLEYLEEADVAAMKKAGTVAVLLPGAFYFIREKQLPPIDLLRRYGVPIAISTDSNPGTSPTTSILLMLNMACTLFRMTVPEVLKGVTVNAARALGKADHHGTLEVGRSADFAVWDVESLAELACVFGRNPCSALVRAGQRVR